MNKATISFPNTTTTRWNPQTVVCCLMVLFISLPMAWVSLGKVMIILALLIAWVISKGRLPIHGNKIPAYLILLIMIIFLVSSLYTPVDTQTWIWSLAKHYKLLIVVAFLTLLSNYTEVKRVITTFITVQSIALLLSYLQLIGIKIPGLSAKYYPFVIFATSYIDQSIMFTLFAIVCWYWSSEVSPPTCTWLLRFISLAALFNVFFLLDGRTGYMVAIATIVLAILWHLPKRWWLPVILILPLTLLSILYVSDHQTHTRIQAISTDIHQYNHHQDIATSSGIRLNMWNRSLEAFEEAPFIGHGVGSWEYSVKKLQGSDAEQVFGSTLTSNPHEEYLLWTVELGLVGTILLLTFFLSIFITAIKSSKTAKHMTVSILAVAMIACLFNSALFDDQIGDFILTVIGLGLALCAHQDSEQYDY